MEQRQVGRSGLWVSRTALGTMTWGKDTSEEEAGQQLTAFVDAGGTFVDTADIYTGGQSERIIGRLLRGTVRREDVVVATKSGHTPEGHRAVDASRRHLLASLEASLRRLQTDYVDLWQLHAFDHATPPEESLAAMESAVASGKVRYVGAGSLEAWQFATMATWQRASPGRVPLVSVGSEYSLLNRGADLALRPAAASVDAHLIAWAPLGRGVLSAKYRKGVPQDSRASFSHMAPYVEPYLSERSRRVVESVCTAAEGLGVPPLAVALSWARDRAGVAAAVVGPRTLSQLEQILDVEIVELPPKIREALDDATSTHGH